MADVKETLVKEAIRKAEEEAAKKNKEAQAIFGGDGNAGDEQASGDAAAKDPGTVEETDKGGTKSDADNTGEGSAEDTGAGKTDDTDAQDDNEADADAGNEAEADDSESDENGTEGNEHKLKKKPGIFGKKNKKDPRDEKIEELNDRLLRNLAEFENFRKRTEKEKTQMFEIGAKSIIEKILPAIDSFERGLASISEADKASPVAEGMEKIYRQLMGSLEEAGLKPIEAVGKEFDPNLHNAVMHEDNDELGENVVSEELQKGYMYRDSIVRHSMVKVAN